MTDDLSEKLKDWREVRSVNVCQWCNEWFVIDLSAWFSGRWLQLPHVC